MSNPRMSEDTKDVELQIDAISSRVSNQRPLLVPSPSTISSRERNGSRDQYDDDTPIAFTRRASHQIPADLDVKLLHTDLAEVNPFRKPIRNYGSHFPAGVPGAHDQVTQHLGVPVLMWEYAATGESEFKSLSLRELLSYVNEHASRIDAEHHVKHVKITRGSTSASKQNLEADGTGSNVSTTSSGGSSRSIDAVNFFRLRDLRRLEQVQTSNYGAGSSAESCVVLVRRHAVLFSLEPLRAIVMADRLIMIVPDGADSVLQVVENYMGSWNKGSDSSSSNPESPLTDPHSPRGHEMVPFESHAYDALFTMTMSIQSTDFRQIDSNVQSILKLFNQKGCILPIHKQEHMRTLKNTVSQLSTWLGNLRKALENVIDDDEGMALMNLTRLRDNPQLYRYPLSSEILGSHEEIEELLESYLMDYSTLQNRVEYLKTLMQSAEEFVSLRLDTARNELLVTNTMFSVLSSCIAFSAYISGVFGMNLDNTIVLQSIPNLFYTLFAVTGGMIFVMFFLIVSYLRSKNILPTRTSRALATKEHAS